MSSPRGRRDRGNRNRQSRRPKTAPDQPYHYHPIFGNIPLLERQWTDRLGETHTSHDYDPDFEPKMPEGAVRGDVTRQLFCRMCHVPHYFYVDQPRECVQCGRDFVFSAGEQKYWYESLQFNFNSVAIRCKDCRRQQRTLKALRAQMAAALGGLRENPDDPSLLLSDAEACVRYRQQTGQGDLDRAIASARRAAKLWPEAVEGLFWEGMAHDLAGRRRTARKLLTRFLADDRTHSGRHRALARETRDALDSLKG